MDLHYDIQGKGDPVVLLHSGGVDSRDWQFIAPKLAQTHQVITYDQRGAGKSSPRLEPVNHFEDFRQLLDFLNIDKAVLVGHSIGGQIATDFALSNPERVTKLVLVAPGLTGFQFSPEFDRYVQAIWAAVPDVEKMLEVTLNSPVYAVHMVMNSPQRDRFYQIKHHNVLRAFEWKNFDQVWRQPPAIERLNELKSKTLFIIGTQESEDCYRIAEFFKRVPDIRFAQIEGADHIPTLTHPQEVNRLITQFLSESQD